MLRTVFWLSFAAVGLYYEWGAALIAAALLLYLWKKKDLRLRINDALLAACGISLFYAVGWLWAVDSGVAVWGAVKHLPVALFALCLLQEEAAVRRKLLGDIPLMGVIMTGASFVLQFVPMLEPVFTVSGRLAGAFQYPNTYACFVLLGLEILLLDRETPCTWRQALWSAVLVFGLLQSGSRAVMVLAVPALVICLVLRKERKTLLMISGAAAAAVVLAVGITAVGIGGADRVGEITAQASTFVGRFLYWKDALPQILQHPFGLGYLGYYFTQGSFQTGVYTVRWAHNDILQLLLDVGWVPTVLAMLAVWKAVFSRRVDALRRVVLLTLLAHCAFDFDLQFAAMYFVVLLCLDWEDGKLRKGKLPRMGQAALSAALAVACLYIGTVTALSYNKLYDAALTIYPWDTFSQVEQMQLTADPELLEQQAQAILDRNESVALAWDAKALAAYARGDFGTLIQCKRRAIDCNRYALEEYVDYFQRLREGEQLYRRAGDTTSADVCRREILAIGEMIRQVLETTDPLAWRIADKPELEMPAEYEAYCRANG